LAARQVVAREARRERRHDDLQLVGQRKRREALGQLDAIGLARAPAIAGEQGGANVGPPNGLRGGVPEHALAERVAGLDDAYELRFHALCRRSAEKLSSFCSATNASTSPPMTIFVHQLLSCPLKEM